MLRLFVWNSPAIAMLLIKQMNLKMKIMIRLKHLLWASLLVLPTYANGQDSDWEPQKTITGYIALEGDYFKDLQYYSREYGMSVSEAGMLASYQPVKNLTLKTVFVYRPDLSIDQMLNEANAEYKINNWLNIKAGRFLTPLSSTNTFYYAPVNVSATLPMITSFHETFPLNMDAVSFNGKIGETFRVGYDVFGGGYRNSLYLTSGALGFFGAENEYFQKVSNAAYSTVNTSTTNSTLSFGGGAHIDFSYKDYGTIGFNVFKSAKESTTINLGQGGFVPAGVNQTSSTTDTTISTQKLVLGTSLKFRIYTVQVEGEYWNNNVNTGKNKLTNEGAFVTVSNTFGKFTPYARFEYLKTPFTRLEDQTATSLKYNRYTAGLNFKPTFETTFKLEYLYYKYNSKDLGGLVATVIYSF
jgi:hypothetical protein